MQARQLANRITNPRRLPPARNTFIIDPKGNIAKVFPAVKVATHSEEVLAALAELQKK